MVSVVAGSDTEVLVPVAQRGSRQGGDQLGQRATVRLPGR
jgi:hypothetical protein